MCLLDNSVHWNIIYIFTSYSLVFERHHANSRSLICAALSRTVGSVNLKRNSVAGDFIGLNKKIKDLHTKR